MEELQNQKKTRKQRAASPPLGFPIQLKYPKNQTQVLEKHLMVVVVVVVLKDKYNEAITTVFSNE